MEMCSIDVMNFQAFFRFNALWRAFERPFVKRISPKEDLHREMVLGRGILQINADGTALG